RRGPRAPLREVSGRGGEAHRAPHQGRGGIAQDPALRVGQGRAGVSFDLAAYMADRAQAVDGALDRFLPPESAPPESPHKAMRYSGFAGGQPLRPVLVAAGAEGGGGTLGGVMPAAWAVEMIHTSSLIHDDLPAMDNDDFRCGVPTSHKVFGEAIAILAGDALLTLAFRLLANSSPAGGEAGRLRATLIQGADAAGSAGTGGGQGADIASAGG